jgi:hypothetical protein
MASVERADDLHRAWGVLARPTRLEDAQVWGRTWTRLGAMECRVLGYEW